MEWFYTLWLFLDKSLQVKPLIFLTWPDCYVWIIYASLIFDNDAAYGKVKYQYHVLELRHLTMHPSQKGSRYSQTDKKTFATSSRKCRWHLFLPMKMYEALTLCCLITTKLYICSFVHWLCLIRVTSAFSAHCTTLNTLNKITERFCRLQCVVSQISAAIRTIWVFTIFVLWNAYAFINGVPYVRLIHVRSLISTHSIFLSQISQDM